MAEVVAMVVVYGVRDWPYPLQVLLDASIMVVIIFPMLYLLSFKPLLINLQERNQADQILQARLHLMQYANEHTLDELLQFTLDEIESLTGSTIGFFHFLEGDQKTLWLQAWSSNTLQSTCKAEGKDKHYDVEQAGVWADAVRLRQPVIHNNYIALPDRKGLPEGHAPVVRELVVPILRDQQVEAIIGLGNKPVDFSTRDVEIVSTLADFAWDIVKQKQAEIALRLSEEKFRTLADWTYDWEKWLDPSGKIVYTSPSCLNITGYTPEELLADPDLLVLIVHPEDRASYEEHLKVIHNASQGPVRIEYRIISRDGEERWIEHICRPLFSQDQLYLGRRISNRDITQRKQAQLKIIEQNKKEAILTQTIQNLQADIARDLHDTLGQNISLLRMNLAYLGETELDDQLKIQIQNMSKVADEAYDLIRSLLAVLQLGFSADPLSLFQRYASQVSARSSIQIELISQGEPSPLSPNQTRHLFYIFRETLNNIEKHAQAHRVTGEFLWGEHTLTLGISDDGNGFDSQTPPMVGHNGINFMRERAELLRGSFLVNSAPNQGTRIAVVVPYENPIPSQST